MSQNSEPSRDAAPQHVHGASDAELLDAVRGAVGDTYEVLGVMGHVSSSGSEPDGRDTVVLLGRALQSAQLVALRLHPEADGYSVEIAQRLDASDAADAAACPRCGAPVVEWGRFCARCGGELPVAEAPASREELLDAVRGAAAGTFEILGEMARADGDGVVYLARERATGRIVTLRLRREADAGEAESYELGETRVMTPLVARLGERPSATPPPPAVPAPPATEDSRFASPAAPTPTREVVVPPVPLAQPSPQRATPQEVLLPEADTTPGEVLPPRPRDARHRRTLVGAALLVVAVLAVLVVVREREAAPDATGGNGARLAAGGGASAARPVTDSAAIEIGGALPQGARITVNGQPVAGSRIVLPAGSYELSATAPGYVGVRQLLTVVPGQTLAWSPALAPEPHAPTPAPAQPTRATERPAPRREARPAVSEPPRHQAATPAPSCQASVAAHDWSAAAAACRSEAQAGDVSAALALARLYQRGEGVPRDSAQGIVWLRSASDAGSAEAARQLGALYHSGTGVRKDARQSLAWYRKAALLGDTTAQIAVGRAYEDGAGVSRDPEQAAAWYTRAAQQGSAWAQNYVGWLYGMGRGVPHDDKEAVRWFAKAAGQGNAQAQYNLGFMYANGRGVAQSDSTAVAWYRRSAAQGYPDALRALAERGMKP